MRWHRIIPSLVMSVLALSAAGPLYAASPYDDYYNSYQQSDSQPAVAAPIDNDAYYSAPGQYPVDNDAYYSAPGTYSSGYATQGQSSNCNTIGDMPSCGSD